MCFAAQDSSCGLDEPEDKLVLVKVIKEDEVVTDLLGQESRSCCPITFLKSSMEITPLYLAACSCPSSQDNLRKNSAEG